MIINTEAMRQNNTPNPIPYYLLACCWLALLMWAGLALVSSNFGWTIFFLILAFVCYSAWSQTPERKAYQAQQRAAAKKALELAEQANKELEQKFYSLTQNPKDPKLLAEVLTQLKALPKPQIKRNLTTIALPLLSLLPYKDEVRDVVFSLAQQVVGTVTFSGEVTSKELYDLALQLLEQHPTQPKMKQFVLDVGRWHFGKLRGGRSTIYDEQAIQNDIIVRSK